LLLLRLLLLLLLSSHSKKRKLFHAARQLLHRGVNLSFVNVTIFLSGLPVQKRRGAPRRIARRICLLKGITPLSRATSPDFWIK
jgi:hypothetical protein